MKETKIQQFKKGNAVVVQNSPNPGYFYIVRSGRLVVDSEHRLSDKELSYFESGDSFGLVSALTGHLFLVTVYAETDSEVLQIPIQMLGSYMKGQKELALKIMRLYTRELRALQKHLSKANSIGQQDFHPERLLGQAKTYIQWERPKLAAYALNRFLEWARANSIPTEQITQAEDLLKSTESDYSGPVWSGMHNELDADEVLFLENEESREIYVVGSGSVRLFRIVRGHEYVMDVLGEGEIFGEMSLLDNATRMASAITLTPAEIMRLTPENIFENVGEQLMQKIYESLARRIWFSHQRLIILRLDDPVTRLYAFLYNSIRDQDIKQKRKLDKSLKMEHVFNMSFDELKTMCGILRIKEETLKPFLNDTNIEIEDNRITVKARKRIEDKLTFFKTRAGQIAANLM